MSTARNRDMLCHTCGGKGHFKRDCPNRKVMIINEDNEYETRDDVDPNAPEDDDYDTDGEDAYPSDARTIVVSQRALNVFPSASTQRCNLFQTKALVGPDKACKEFGDVFPDEKISRNWTKLRPGSYFSTEFPDRRRYGVGPRGGDTTGAARQEARAAYGVGPSAPPTLPFRLLKLSNPITEQRYGKVPEDAAAANPISGIQEFASGTVPERESSPEGSTSPCPPPD
ncbi:hypothetical protein QYE76_056180 [Lolium multiflorum]|uniref:CCHC-type domain-containing protein n=1 Tax=Lolium multiflorum TaxID=4521 RepID=A0AAD8WMZ2_LOLMU|nr:hypothetical protein QYE76_056180 [Lolium multiflorum]